MFYGNSIDEDVLYEITILNEMHISKNDLKDPNILKKVLEKSKKEDNTAQGAIMTAGVVLGIAADVIAGIVAGSVFLSIVAFLPFIIGACALALTAIQKLPDFEKINLDKLEAKTRKLKEKASKLKDGPEKKKIIETCDKILKSIAEYKKKKINDAKQKEYEEAKKFVLHIINAIKGKSIPFEYPENVYEFYDVAKQIGIESATKVLDEGYVKYCQFHSNLDNSGGVFKLITEGYDNYDDAIKGGLDEEYLNKFAAKIPGFKENSPVCNLACNADYYFFFNHKNKTFYYCGTYANPELLDSNKSLYSLVSKHGIENAKKFSKKEIEMYKQIYESLKGNQDK